MKMVFKLSSSRLAALLHCCTSGWFGGVLAGESDDVLAGAQWVGWGVGAGRVQSAVCGGSSEDLEGKEDSREESLRDAADAQKSVLSGSLQPVPSSSCWSANSGAPAPNQHRHRQFLVLQ